MKINRYSWLFQRQTCSKTHKSLLDAGRTIPWVLRTSVAVVLPFLAAVCARSQTHWKPEPLDPARDPAGLVNPHHAPLAEQYIWTAGDAAALRPDHSKFTYRDHDKKTEPHAFRVWFTLGNLPGAATLYIAGPRSARAWINGQLVLDASADPHLPLGTHVFRADIHTAMRVGRNLLAIEAVRGRGIVAASDSKAIQQIAFGETLVAKILPAPPGVAAPPLVISNSKWRSALNAPVGWQLPNFNDGSWPFVQSLGSIEGSSEFFQWNTDAGMYDWPGYMGLSPYLRTYTISPVAVTHQVGNFSNVEALTSTARHDPFSVGVSAAATESPSLLLDFGREIAGRLLVTSACHCEAQILVSYGESEGEAMSGGQYLGTNLLRIPPGGEARGPKSAFRYAFLRFTGGSPQTPLRSIRAEGIAYPVAYRGSFESSDPLLNRIWETAAYTAHLCMQDDVWDAPKRDRGRWAGDLDVAGLTIEDVFGQGALLNTTLTRLIPSAGSDVNGIPGYSALWITTLANLYRHSNDKSELEQKRKALLGLLAQMDSEIDPTSGFINKNHRWLFVDWSPGLYAFTDQAMEGTEFEFIRAYRDGAWLLSELGDRRDAEHYNARADTLAAQARNRFAGSNGTYGASWQLNAMAVLSGAATQPDYSAIWDQVFSRVGPGAEEQTITPYFNDYLLDAMAQMGHRREALDWLRSYWGGMLAEGATSFWEAYDLRWPKDNPHLYLQADGTTGYFVSLAHGWSSGPAPWLMEEVLGVKAIDPGFRTVQIRPDLAGLGWARGAVPTPLGQVQISAELKKVDVTIPAGIAETIILLPAGKWLCNGEPVHAESAEAGLRDRIVLHHPGHYEFTMR